MTQYKTQYGTIFALKEHNGAPAIMCRAEHSETWSLSSMITPFTPGAWTAEDLQEQLDNWAATKGWQPVAEPASAEPPEQTKEDYSPCEGCRCPDCDDEACPQAHCDKSDKGLGCIAPDDDCPPQNPTAAAPASPADAGAAEQSMCAAGPASLAAKDVNVPAFDFSALGDLAGQAAEADEQFNLHYGRAQDEFLVACIYMARIHALTAKAGRYGGGTWTSWYQSKGISEGSARTMVQNGDGFKSATVADLKNLPALTKKDINLIARQGAAEQVLEAAGQGDSARIQEIMAEIRARDAKIKDLLEMSEAADRRADEEERKRKEANEARVAAENKVQQYREIKDAALETAKQQREKTAAAESRARAAERERDEARKERDGAREALQASKMRGDRLKAENDDLKARPIEVPAVDEDEIDRRVEARLQQERDDSLAEQREIAARNAQDAILLLGRQINTSWQMVRPFLAEMEESRRVEAIDRINREWAQTQKEIMQCL